MSDIWGKPQELLDPSAGNTNTNIPASNKNVFNQKINWGEVENRSTERTAERESNVNKWGFSLSDEQFMSLNNAVANGKITVDEGYNLATTLALSKQYNLPPAFVRENLDQILSAINAPAEGHRLAQTNFRYVINKFNAGVSMFRFSDLGKQLRDANSRGDTKLAEQVKQQRRQLQEELYQNSDPDERDKNFFTRAIGAAAESLPFTAYVAGTAFLGSLLTPGVGTAAAFLSSMSVVRDIEYAALIDAGAKHEVADGVSLLSGAIQAGFEVFLGNTLSVASGAARTAGRKLITENVTRVLIEKATANAFKNAHGKGLFLKTALHMGGDYLGQMFEEGLEELLQEFTSAMALEAANALQEGGVDTFTAEEIWENMSEAFKGGAMASIFLGIPGTGMNAGASIKSWQRVKSEAKHSGSETEFIDRTKEEEIWKDMPDEERLGHQKAAYAAAQSLHDQEQARTAEDISSTTGLGDAYEVSKTGQAAPLGEIYRRNNNLLYTELDEKRGLFKIGDPRVDGKKNLYAHIGYTQDENGNVKINEFHVRNDLETPEFRREAFTRFAEAFAGQEITWDIKTTREAEIKQDLINNNNRGETAGLNYYFDTDTKNIGDARFRNRVIDNFREFFPKFNNTVHSVMAAEWEHFANIQGKSLEEYVNTEFGGLENAFTRNANRRIDAASKEGLKIKGAVSFENFAQDAKAAIYLSQNADLTTFIHEMGHIYRRRLQGDMLKQAEKIWGVTNGKWSEEQEERFTEDLERWRRDGTAPTPEMKSFFEKFAEFLKNIINEISRREKVSPEIKEFFDKLYTGEHTDKRSSADKTNTALIENAPEYVHRLETYTVNKKFNEEERTFRDKNNVEGTPKPVQTEVKNIEDLQRKAINKLSELDKWGKDFIALVKKELGINIEIKERPSNTDNYTGKPYPIKSAAAIQKKLNKGDKIENILDVMGITIVAKNIKEMDSVADFLNSGEYIVRMKDRYHPDGLEDSGYCDFLANIKLSDGMIAEVQINVPQMLAAKGPGHKIYEIPRDFEEAIEKKELTLEEAKRDKNILIEISKNFYGTAKDAVYAESNFSASSRDMERASKVSDPSNRDLTKDLSAFTLNKFQEIGLSANNSLQNSSPSLTTNLKSGSSNEGTETLSDMEKPSTNNIEQKTDSVNDKKKENDIDVSGVPSIRESYEAAEKAYGDEDVININGEEVEVRYVVMEADTPTASHNEVTFNETEGFPKIKGKNANTRKYKDDIEAQRAVITTGSDYDSRALDELPIITTDGIVINGARRTMGSKLAAKNNSDEKYLKSFARKAKRAGFSEEQIKGFKHPRLLMEIEINGNYNAALFHSFNQDGRKADDPVEEAVRMTKLIEPQTVKAIADVIAKHESINDLYKDKQSLLEIFNIIKTAKLIGEYEMPKYFTEHGGISGAGVDLLENTLLGATLHEDNIRVLSDSKGLRRKLARALPQLVENRAMGEYSVIQEVNEAVRIAAEVEKNSKTFKNVMEWAAQRGFDFVEQKNQIAIELAKRLENDSQSGFADIMGGLNAVLSDAAAGQGDLLSAGIEDKKEIVRRFLGIKAEIDRIREANNKIIESETATNLEKSGAAMSNAELAKGEAGLTFFQAAYHGEQTLFQTEELTEDQKETIEAAKSKYGTTTNIKEAGYLLKDGSMLDFSGKNEGGPSGHRSLDHKEMDYFEHDEKVYKPGKWNFIAQGNIRLMPEVGGICLSKLPNAEQAATLKKYIQHFNGETIIDFVNENSDTINSIEYNSGTKAIRILNDIKNYYENGIVPEQKPTFFQLDESEKSDIISDEELEEIGLAYGSREKYKQALRDAVGRILFSNRRDTGTSASFKGLPAKRGRSLLPESELQKIKRLNIVGKQINSSDDAAALFSLFRDPRIEVFNILYTSETGEVLAHTAWTSGLPNHTIGMPVKKGYQNDDVIKEIQRVKDTMEALNAKKIWIAHNHPSGNITPSVSEDIGSTKKYFTHFGDSFAGHIVLDHDKYTFIKPSGFYSEEKLKIPAKNFINKSLSVQGDMYEDTIANAFKGVLSHENDTDVLAVLDNENRIVSWNYLDEQRDAEQIFNYMKVTGGLSVIILSNNDSGYNYYEEMSLINKDSPHSIFIDIIKVDKETGLIDKSFPNQNYNWASYQMKERPTLKLIDNQTDQPVLFQLLDDDLVEDAARFESWQEFRDSIEQGEVTEADNAWYRSLWNDAKKIYEDDNTLFQDEDEKTGRAQELDDRFYKEADRNNLSETLRELLRIHNDQSLEPAKEDSDAALDEYQRIKRLQHRINTELPNSGSLIGIAAKLRGADLSPDQYNRIKTWMRKNKRDYRSVLADIMNREEYLEDLAEVNDGEPAGRLANPRPEKVDIKRRLKEIALIIRETDSALADEIENGTISYDDPRITAFEAGTDALYKKAKEVLDNLEKETAEEFARLTNNVHRHIVSAHDEMIKLREKLDITDEKIQRMMDEEGKIAESYTHRRLLDKTNYGQALEAYNDLKKHAEINSELREVIARRETKASERARYKSIIRQQRAVREFREIKQKLVKRVTRKVSLKTTAFEQAETIMTIQRLFLEISDGINKWIGVNDRRVLRAIWSQWSTDEEQFRDKLLEKFKIYPKDKEGTKKRKKENAKKITDILNKEWDQITDKDKKTLHKLLPKTDFKEKFALNALNNDIKETIQLDIDESQIDNKTVLYLGDALKRKVIGALGDELFNRIQNKPLNEWSVTEAEELARVIDKLTVDGRRERAAYLEAERFLNERYRNEVIKALENVGIEDDDTPEERERKLNKLKKYSKGKKNNLLNNFFDANLRRFTTALDGGRKGIFTNLLYWGENDAFNQRQRRIADRRAVIDKVMKEHNIKHEELFSEVKISELDGFDVYRVSGGKLTIDDLLYILRGSENEETRQAIKFGNLSNARERRQNETDPEGFEITAEERMRSILVDIKAFFAKTENKKFMKLYEAIGTDYDGNGQRLNRACIEMFNQPMWRVENYVPMNRRERTGKENENRVIEDLLGITGKGQKRVNKGQTIKRIKIKPSGQRPIELGLYKTWAKSVESTEHLLAYAPLVKKLNGVFKGYHAAEVRQVAHDRWGEAALDRIDNTIAEYANPNPTRQRGKIDELVRTLRGKTATAYLAWKTSGVLKQLVTSPWPYLQEIPPQKYIAAFFEVAGGAGKINNLIREKSIYMKERDFDPMVKMIKEAREKNDNALLSKLDRFNKLGMKGLEMVDWACVAPGWLAKYRDELVNVAKEQEAEYQKLLKKYQGSEYADVLPTLESKEKKARSEIMSDEQQDAEAVARADDIVRRLQPSSRQTDLSPIYKNQNEIGNILLQFQTALNVIWQNIRYDMPLAVKEKRIGTIVGMITGYMMAGICLGLLTEGFDDDDDEAKKARKILFYSVTQFTDAAPIIGGDVINPLARVFITGKAGYYNQSNLPAVEKAFSGLKRIGKAVWENDPEKQKKLFIYAVLNIAEGAGILFGAPVSGFKELLRLGGIGDGDGEFELYLEALMGRRKN